MLLWRLVRDVELWAGTPAEAQAKLFAPGARDIRTARLHKGTFPTDVRLHLRQLNRLLAAPASPPTSADEVSTACAAVAEWAREIEARETALAYAQAAALASDAAAHALLTGHCAEEAGQRQRARTWYVRAVALARRARDWQSYALSFLELGRMAEQDGNIARARRLYLRTFRTSRRHRFPAERGLAAAALFRLVAAGNAEMASRSWASAYALLQANAEHLDAAAAAFLVLAECALTLGDLRGIERAGHAALVVAPAEEYPRIRGELVKLAGERPDFGTVPVGAE